MRVNQSVKLVVLGQSKDDVADWDDVLGIEVPYQEAHRLRPAKIEHNLYCVFVLDHIEQVSKDKANTILRSVGRFVQTETGSASHPLTSLVSVGLVTLSKEGMLPCYALLELPVTLRPKLEGSFSQLPQLELIAFLVLVPSFELRLFALVHKVETLEGDPHHYWSDVTLELDVVSKEGSKSKERHHLVLIALIRPFLETLDHS